MITIMFFLIMSGTFNGINSSLRGIGLLSIFILLFITCTLGFLKYLEIKRMDKILFLLLCIALIFSSFSLISSINNSSNFTFRGAENIIQFLLCIGFLLFLSTIRWSNFHIRLVGNLASAFIFVHFIIWSTTGFSSAFSSVYANSNLLGPYILFMLFFIIWARQYARRKMFYTGVIFMGIAVIFGSDTRSALFAGGLALLTHLSWNFISKNKLRFATFLLLIYVGLFSFIFLYPNLPKWRHFPYIENLMLQYTGKSLMSGRDAIWSQLLDKINDRPFLGYGPGTTPADITTIDISAHNLYMQIVLQNGYLGLIVFMVLMLAIWMSLFKNVHNKTVRLAGAFFTAIMVHQSFEITLIQNQLSIGLMQWFIIAVGISASLNGSYSEKNL